MPTDTNQPWTWHAFETREALAAALSESVAAALRIALSASEDRGQETVLAVSGGTTPKAFLNELAKADLPWEQIAVTLCDERFVAPTSQRSNEALVRRELLRDRAQAARFVPLLSSGSSVEEAATAANAVFENLTPRVVVLGMGLDGHTASLLPDASETGPALDLGTFRKVVAIHAASVPEPRISLTLRALASAGNTFLHIEGEEKRRVFEQAMKAEPVLPIRAVIDAAGAAGPVRIFWAP